MVSVVRRVSQPNLNLSRPFSHVLNRPHGYRYQPSIAAAAAGVGCGMTQAGTWRRWGFLLFTGVFLFFLLCVTLGICIIGYSRWSRAAGNEHPDNACRLSPPRFLLCRE